MAERRRLPSSGMRRPASAMSDRARARSPRMALTTATHPAHCTIPRGTGARRVAVSARSARGGINDVPLQERNAGTVDDRGRLHLARYASLQSERVPVGVPQCGDQIPCESAQADELALGPAIHDCRAVAGDPEGAVGLNLRGHEVTPLSRRGSTSRGRPRRAQPG
jgi:hypothetical protein